MSDNTQADVDLATAIRQDHNLAKELFAKCDGGGEAGRDAFDALVRLLAVHETAEEMTLYPTVRAQDGTEDIVGPRLAEEDEAKKQLSALEKMGPDAPEFSEKFRQFKTAVLDHAQHEEQEVLPRLSSVDAEELKRVSKAYAAAKAIGPTHPHPHAPESAIGNLVLGPAVAIMDRARDAVKAVLDKARGS